MKRDPERLFLVRQMPCIACQLWGVHHQPNKTEAHHLNLDGKAGQKRRGDAFTIPLCRWHHQGIKRGAIDTKAMTALYGPSLKLQSKAFRLAFGRDDDLLALVNDQLEVA